MQFNASSSASPGSHRRTLMKRVSFFIADVRSHCVKLPVIGACVSSSGKGMGKASASASAVSRRGLARVNARVLVVGVLLTLVIACCGYLEFTQPGMIKKQLVEELPKTWTRLVERVRGEGGELDEQDKVAQQQSHALTVNMNLQLCILTMATRGVMPELRELVGSAHRHCPRCMVLVYGYELERAQVRELSRWEGVEYFDVAETLLQGLDMRSSINVVQRAIVHAMDARNRVLYVDVMWSFTSTLEEIDHFLHDHGHLLAPGPDGQSNKKVSVVSASIQGYMKHDSSYKKLVLALTAPDACTGSKPCAAGNVIRLPPRFTPHVAEWGQLPIKEQHLADAEISLVLNSIATANSDIRNDNLNRALHHELELFGDDHYAFMRFSLASVKGRVTHATLVLQCAWTSDRKPYGGAIGYSTMTTWDETYVEWNDRPTAVDGVFARFTAAPGDTLRLDVLPHVLNLRKLKPSADAITFIASSDTHAWIKFFSRHYNYADYRPRLELTVRGQGPSYKYIHQHYGAR